MYQNYDLFHEQILQKYDEMAVEVIPNLTLTELDKLIEILAVVKRRNKTVLQEIAANISRQKDCFDIKSCSQLLHNLKKLNYPNTNILMKISEDLSAFIPSTMDSSLIKSILIPLNFLNWRNSKLLNVISFWFERNYDISSSDDLISFIITLGNVNYKPKNFKRLVDIVLPNISKVDNPTIWLDFVWSLVLLGIAKPHHIESVLNDNFIKSLPENKMCAKYKNEDKLQTIYFESLRNVESIDKFLDKTNQSLIYFKFENKRNSLKLDVLNTISMFAYVPKFFFPLIKTQLGFKYDGEIAINEDGLVIPIMSTEKNKKKVAILICDFSFYTVDERHLLGINSYIVRTLSKYGYKVLIIPYFEYNQNRTTSKKIEYIRRKLKYLVK